MTEDELDGGREGGARWYLQETRRATRGGRGRLGWCGGDRCLALRGFRHFVLDNRAVNRTIDVRKFVQSVTQASASDVV